MRTPDRTRARLIETTADGNTDMCGVENVGARGYVRCCRAAHAEKGEGCEHVGVSEGCVRAGAAKWSPARVRAQCECHGEIQKHVGKSYLATQIWQFQQIFKFHLQSLSAPLAALIPYTRKQASAFTTEHMRTRSC